MTPRERALQDRVEELEEEVRQLRRLAFGTAEQTPVEWRLSQNEERIVLALLAVPLASRERLEAALHWDQNIPRSESCMSVTLMKARRKLQRHGFTIENIWGRGWRIPDVQRAAIKSGAIRL